MLQGHIELVVVGHPLHSKVHLHPLAPPDLEAPHVLEPLCERPFGVSNSIMLGPVLGRNSGKALELHVHKIRVLECVVVQLHDLVTQLGR